MCAVPLFSQKAMFKDWLFEFDCRFRKFDTCPLGGVLDKMVWMSKNPHSSEDREAGSPFSESRKEKQGYRNSRLTGDQITYRLIGNGYSSY